jgi:hypothetical protein
MVKLSLRVTMNNRPHIFALTCVIWERGACHLDMLISQSVAVTTGLSIFVHDNLLREAIMGRQALIQRAEQDLPSQPQGTVASIGTSADFEDDEEMFMRISPIESLRKALEQPKLTEDNWVNE